MNFYFNAKIPTFVIIFSYFFAFAHQFFHFLLKMIPPSNLSRDCFTENSETEILELNFGCVNEYTQSNTEFEHHFSDKLPNTSQFNSIFQSLIWAIFRSFKYRLVVETTWNLTRVKHNEILEQPDLFKRDRKRKTDSTEDKIEQETTNEIDEVGEISSEFCWFLISFRVHHLLSVVIGWYLTGI
jgi:hypothetical protein